MKQEIARYVSYCDNYRRIKADHLRPTGNLQPLSIPEWKWENICMDFIVGLPRTSRGYNSIWVIVDRLTKSAHFIPVATTYRVGQYAELYISHIFRYHGIPKTIIFERGSIFVARFWEQLHECLGTHLIRSSAYHPQTDGQTEWVNQIIEDMLRACVLTDGLKWDKHLPLAEFLYNNSYQESIKMSPVEALYGWPCRTPLSWSESGERVIFGPDIVTEEEEKVKQIQANILAAQFCQKSYTDKRRSPLEFEVSDHVYLLSPQWKVYAASVSKENLLPATLVRIPSLTSMGRRLIKWSYQRSYWGFIMCFTSPNSRDVWSLRQTWLLKTPSHWNLIWHTRHILSRFSTNKTESHTTRLLDSTRSNRMSTLKMKPRGNMRNFYEPTTPTSFYQGNPPNRFYPFISILGWDFH
jgi:hypothetical protein